MHLATTLAINCNFPAGTLPPLDKWSNPNITNPFTTYSQQSELFLKPTKQKITFTIEVDIYSRTDCYIPKFICMKYGVGFSKPMGEHFRATRKYFSYS